MKTLAYVLGGMIALDGLWGLLSPRSGFALYKDYIQPYMPESMTKIANDYSRLSSDSIRYMSFWSVLLGLFILLLAYSGFGGKYRASSRES